MPVALATKPDELAMMAAIPMASTWHLQGDDQEQRRLDIKELVQLLRDQCGCSSCIDWRNQECLPVDRVVDVALFEHPVPPAPEGV